MEFGENGDIFACLPHGEDRGVETGRCLKILSVKDSAAAPTGFIFSADGTTACLSIQHSNDPNMPKVDYRATFDVLKITASTRSAARANHGLGDSDIQQHSRSLQRRNLNRGNRVDDLQDLTCINDAQPGAMDNPPLCPSSTDCH